MRAPQSSASLKRKGAKRKSYDRVLIVCEGEKTEPHYLREVQKALSLSATNFRIVDCKEAGGTAPQTIVEAAIAQFAADRDYDRVYCVIDRDGHTTFDAAVDRVRSKKLRKGPEAATPGFATFEVIRSLPCFEFWILLHYEFTTHAYTNSGATIRRLKTHAEMAAYEKANTTLFSRTRHRLFGRNGAFARSRQVHAACERDGATAPLTDIDKLLRDLISIANKTEKELVNLWGSAD